MARPRLGESERRRLTIGVRVTEAEETELRERAQAACLSMGAYLRRRALGQRVRMAAELRKLNRLGVQCYRTLSNEIQNHWLISASLQIGPQRSRARSEPLPARTLA